MIALSVGAVLVVGARQQAVAIGVGGLKLMGADGVPLGSVTCGLIGNPVSPYGSRISDRSIWNPIGKYGSEISDTSAYSRIASKPPALFNANGDLVAYVTLSLIMIPRVSPKRVEAYLIEHCDRDDGYRDRY